MARSGSFTAASDKRYSLAGDPARYLWPIMLATAAWSMLLAGALVVEFARVRRFGTADTSREADLQPGEFGRIVRWCPVPATPLESVGIALGVYALVVLDFGLGPQPAGDPETIEDLRVALTAMATLLIAYPVLASASRMQGTCAEQFHPRLRRHDDA
jgi:hypothetical protein